MIFNCRYTIKIIIQSIVPRTYYKQIVIESLQIENYLLFLYSAIQY